MGDAKRRRIDDDSQSMTYSAQRILGKGSFGVVYQAQVLETNEIVAIKSIRMAEKDREIQILKELDGHPNVVCLKGAFISHEGANVQDQRLNIVLEFFSDTLHRVIKHYDSIQKTMPAYWQKMYLYQLLRGLAFIHGKGILHADIKPQNLLLDGGNQALKLCDFGTARRMMATEPLRPYICSRYYRAPELILGSTTYNNAIDLWSAGAVFAEMILGQPLFTGKDGIDQLVEIIKVLGTPTVDQVKAMNANYTEFQIEPAMAPFPWEKVLKSLGTPEAYDIAGKLMKFEPSERVAPLPALKHAFFNELRAEHKPQHRQLFNFREDELWWASAQDKKELVPAWYRIWEKEQQVEEAYKQGQGPGP